MPLYPIDLFWNFPWGRKVDPDVPEELLGTLNAYGHGEINLKLQGNCESSPKFLLEAGSTGLLKSLDLRFSESSGLADSHAALRACTSLEKFTIHISCCEEMTALLKCAQGYTKLHSFRLAMRQGDLQHLKALPAILMQFPALRLLELDLYRLVPDAAEREQIAGAIRSDFPHLLVDQF